jgi:hypothetical protein
MTAPYMDERMASRFDPALVAPLVSWLCSEACAINGEVLVSGAGLLRRASVGETQALALDAGPPGEVFTELAKLSVQSYPSANDSFARLLEELAQHLPENTT